MCFNHIPNDRKYHQPSTGSTHLGIHYNQSGDFSKIRFDSSASGKIDIFKHIQNRLSVNKPRKKKLLKKDKIDLWPTKRLYYTCFWTGFVGYVSFLFRIRNIEFSRLTDFDFFYSSVTKDMESLTTAFVEKIKSTGSCFGFELGLGFVAWYLLPDFYCSIFVDFWFIQVFFSLVWFRFVLSIPERIRNKK